MGIAACLSAGFPVIRIDVAFASPEVERGLILAGGPALVIALQWIARRILLGRAFDRPAATNLAGAVAAVEGPRRIALAILYCGLSSLTGVAFVALWITSLWDSGLPLTVITATVLAAVATLVSLFAAIGLGISRPWGRTLAEIYAFSLIGVGITLAGPMILASRGPFNILPQLGVVVLVAFVGLASVALALLRPTSPTA